MSASSRAAPAARSAPEGGGKVRGIVAGVVTLAAGGVIYFTLVPMPPKFDRAPHTALGQVLAREALKLQQPGGRIIFITRDTTMFKTPAFEAQSEGFEKELRKAGAKIAVKRVLKVDPLRVVAVPPGDFFELLRKANEKDVIVSLLGPPVLDAAQIGKLTENRPHVIAVCSGAMPQQVDLKRLFDQRLIEAVVISRNEPASAGGANDGFDRHFKLITTANLSDLLPLPAAKPLR